MSMGTATIAVANLWKGGGGGRVLFLSLFSTSKCSYGHYLPLLRKIGNSTCHSNYCHNKGRIAATSSRLSSSAARASFCIAVSASAAGDAVIEPTTPSTTVSDHQQQEWTKIMDAADMLDIRVGRILRAWRHGEADSLYVEEVDVGEPEPRIICSGLVNFIPLEHLEDTKVVVLANLKPRNMRGVKSCGMLMAASDASHGNVEILVPPEGSIPGERIWFGSEHDRENQAPTATPNQIQKKKIWEFVQPHLKTDDCCIAMLGEHVMRTSAGVVLCTSLKNASIS
ncbi:hypothetical protein FNV43_RR07199 [Rhamnella rubrinervis]|uniref:tRNA-binding domain-containing protein n=1 Tax=Rhamnella rubrinervis TaxID=2594499 RepID=A0A8K0HG22_9ROSA|nr:hypothetical protein FNV43_RR07199 [Rhamnella rubrinervis]